MKKLFFLLALVAMSVLSYGQDNQLVWANGRLLYGTPVAGMDSLTYDETEDVDTLHLLLPRTLVKVVHDTVYIHDTVYVETDCGSTTPTPSADYIYSNGYCSGADPKDIISFEPYEIALDADGKFAIELICPEEIPSYEDGTYFDIIFTVDVPNTYIITNFEYYDEGTTNYYEHKFKENPRHSTVVRNGVTYNSFVRSVFDNKDIASEGLKYAPYRYKITIEKK